MGSRAGQVYIGADLGGNNLRAALVGPGGTILHRYHRPTAAGRAAKTVMAAVADSFRVLQEEAHGLGYRVVGAGLGVPGLVRPSDGTVQTSPNFPTWVDVPLKGELERLLPFPVHVENDVNAIAVGESEFGAGRGIRNLLMVTLGTGVGGGLILEGHLWRGPDGTAGEIGHFTVRPGGRRCGCGNRGCLETYSSATAIERRAVDAGLIAAGQGGADRLAQLARQGVPGARALFRDAGRYLGLTLAGVANLLNLEMAIIGGGIARSWDLFGSSVSRELTKRAFAIPGRRLRVALSSLFDDAGVLGAAVLASAAGDGWLSSSEPV